MKPAVSSDQVQIISLMKPEGTPMRRFLLLLLVFVAAGFLSCGRSRVRPVYPRLDSDIPVDTDISAKRSPLVRVLIHEGSKNISVTVESADIACRRSDGSITDGFKLGGDLRVSRSGGELNISRGGRAYPKAPAYIIRPPAGKGFSINGKRYRGDLILAVSGQRGIIAINIIEIDDYLRGVLPSEIGYLKQGQYQAYLVQAVASRSYALSKLDEKKGELYDLRATIMDQVYRGIGGENNESSRAIDETHGFVALWNGEPIKAYYSSCCGGYTADIRVGWPWKTDFPYLRGARDAAGAKGISFCRGSHHFRWDLHWGGRDLLRILKKSLPAELGTRVALFNKLIDIRVTGRSKSGRARAVRITTDNGSYEVRGDRIRWVLRPLSADGAILKSTLFKMKVKRAGGRVRSVDLTGGGNGHGTGMCQTGAIRMAELGYSFRDILLHYYPGITVERVY